MRTSKHDSTSEKRAGQLKKGRRSGTESFCIDKENKPLNNSRQNALLEISAHKGGGPLIDITKNFNSQKGSPILTTKYECRLNTSVSKSPTGSPNERRKRCLTPKTLKELLGERKKLGIGLKSPTEKENKKPIAVRITEILAQSKARAQAQSEVSSPQLNGPGSPGPTSPSELFSTQGKDYALTKIGFLIVTTECINHDNKRSKFYLIEDVKVVTLDCHRDYRRGFCSKCAVRLANAGFKVEEIEGEDQDVLKCTEFSTFINRVSASSAMVSTALADNRKKQSLTESHYNSLLSTSDNLKQCISNMVDHCFDEYKKSMTSERHCQLEHLKQCEATLRQYQKDLGLFAENLGENFQETIRVMDLQSLKANIQRFDTQISNLVNHSRRYVDENIDFRTMANFDGQRIKDLEASMFSLLATVNQTCIDNELDNYRHELMQMFSQTFSSSMAQKAANNVYVSFDGSAAQFSLAISTQRAAEQVAVSRMMNMSQTDKDSFSQSFSVCPDDPLFILTPTEADFAMKQTPELGHNKQPQYLTQHLTNNKARCHKVLFANDALQAIESDADSYDDGIDDRLLLMTNNR